MSAQDPTRSVSFSRDEQDSRPKEDKETSEYVALNRYISSASEKPGGPVSESGNEDANNRKPWWQFWHRAHSASDVTYDSQSSIPHEWEDTDIHTGLSAKDIEMRRRKCGFNELGSKRQNMFLQFLSYFQGPILYGMSRGPPSFFPL